GGEAGGDVGNPVQLDVVQDDQLVIGGGHQVLLEKVGSKSKGQRFGLQRMFRQIAGRAAMGDDQRLLLLPVTQGVSCEHGDSAPVHPVVYAQGKSMTSQRAVSSSLAWRRNASAISREFHSMCSLTRSTSSGGVSAIPPNGRTAIMGMSFALATSIWKRMMSRFCMYWLASTTSASASLICAINSSLIASIPPEAGTFCGLLQFM